MAQALHGRMSEHMRHDSLPRTGGVWRAAHALHAASLAISQAVQAPRRLGLDNVQVGARYLVGE